MKTIKFIETKKVDIVIYVSSGYNWIISLFPSIIYDYYPDFQSRILTISFLCFAISFEW